MTSQERHDAEDLLRYLLNNIYNMDSKVIGFNVGANCGDAAGADCHACPYTPYTQKERGYTEPWGWGKGCHSREDGLLTQGSLNIEHYEMSYRTENA
jgi:hypothetical protein